MPKSPRRPSATAITSWSLDIVSANKLNFIANYPIIHVAKTGSDTSGDGSEGNPYLTIQHALDTIINYFLSSDVTICVHEGSYDEAVTFYGIYGSQSVLLKGAEGENVQIKAIQIWNCDVNFEIYNLEIIGDLGDQAGCSMQINNARFVLLNNIKCTNPQIESPWYGAVRISNTNIVTAYNVTVSNKQIAFDILASTLYLNDTDTGENNTVAIRCGSGWGSYGGFAQKGGATISGIEQTAYSGQIF